MKMLSQYPKLFLHQQLSHYHGSHSLSLGRVVHVVGSGFAGRADGWNFVGRHMHLDDGFLVQTQMQWMRSFPLICKLLVSVPRVWGLPKG